LFVFNYSTNIIKKIDTRKLFGNYFAKTLLSAQWSTMACRLPGAKLDRVPLVDQSGQLACH